MTQSIESFNNDKEIKEISERFTEALYFYSITEINKDGERIRKYKSLWDEMEFTKLAFKTCIMLDRENRRNK